MKHLGDITKVKGDEIEVVDCVVFGAPCQDLSIAGLRKGLKHTEHGDEETTRSGLFFEATRIIKEMRDNELERIRSIGTDEPIRPRYAIYENVPGAYSSNQGEDFRSVLEALIHIRDKTFTVPRCKDGKWSSAGLIIGDDWSIAWRTMDAQYWGVPQRRKRIALVMDFAGRSAGEILFESQGLSGDIEQGIKTWKGIAKCPEECTTKCDTDTYTAKVRGGQIPTRKLTEQ